MNSFSQARLIAGILLTGLLMASVAPLSASASSHTIIDDFEDGDASDWNFFGGNMAGGGGGAASDRPQEGSFYFSTGWGGEGTASSFYGGAFKNFDDTAQVTPPAADPWFNVWVYNESIATVDEYNLEITLREDTNGDGWTNGAEDSIQLVTNFSSADFNDQWTLISAPLSSFTNIGTGGDGTFNGDLDEIVIVMGGVEGGPGTVIEVDFDQFSFTEGAPNQVQLEIIDDFEDNDTSDWGFFGGNNAGGGGGPASDRPQEGSFYFSTGWGGEGTASSFYGGAFKNFDDTAQITPPADPWFNVWVYNQSDATVDQYTLEITIREDLNGDGWTNGAEDSFRLDTTFTSADFNDQWTLISAPLSSFTDLFTGGDGTFNGNLDEVVIVVAGVQGANPSVVELDFDQFSFSSGPLDSGQLVTVFDDMEHGDPFANDYFIFFGGAGGGIGPNSADLPPANGGSFSLETGWGSGGTPGYFGGFGRTNPININGTDHFNFWINPDPGQDYTLEINLQEDDTGEGAFDGAVDDEFRFACTVTPTGPCAVSGGGWQLVSIPLADFFDTNAGGNGTLDGSLINVVYVIVSNSGADVVFRTDYWAFSDGPIDAPEPMLIIDDFEDGLPRGTDSDGVDIGFYTFSDGSPISIATTDTPPAPLPGSAAGNNVLAMTGDIDVFAGFIHGFENDPLDTWTPQDWSLFEGFSVWVYGQNTGQTLFIDIIDNRNPGSTTDDGERFSVEFPDNFSGWQLFEFPFDSFNRKEIGNGAPNDGFTLTQVHGWALGVFNPAGTSVGSVTHYVDDAKLYGTAEIPDLAVTFSDGGYAVTEGATADITVELNRPMNSSDPAQVSVDFTTEVFTAIPDVDFVPISGTLTFVNGGPSQLTFPLATIDDNGFTGTKTVGLALDNPVDVASGFQTRATAFILDDESYDPLVLDEFEEGAFLFDANGDVSLSTLILGAGDPLARPGQGAFENVLQINGPQNVEIEVFGKACKPEKGSKGSKGSKDGSKGSEGSKGSKDDTTKGTITVHLLTTDTFDALTVDHNTVTLGDAKEKHFKKKTGTYKRHEKDVDKDGDLDLVFHFKAKEANVDCGNPPLPFNGFTYDGQAITAGGSDAAINRDFAASRDWSQGEALSFWMYGTGSGVPITVELKDNRAPDPGPSGWSLVWAEEFNEPAGTLPNPDIWSYEIGDGSANGIPGWGNDELQYYTDDPENAAMDGGGNLVITLREADGSLDCYYGPCEYTSARLITQNKAEFAYGRIESRLLVPDGGSGLWPAFWSLGTDITYNPWPGAGEIDFMEYVSRLPNEIFGTIHGPGYNGGGSFNGIYDFGGPVSADYHTFTVEWQPNLIEWYVDGIKYHEATPADVPGPWVFEKPFFLLLNFAIGGNFGGAVDPANVYPQEYAIDYIRVFQGPDTAERFEATVVDDVAGWRKVEVPFADFTRSAEQPAGAPDDGLNLDEVWGYGFKLPQGGSFLIDEVRLELPPPVLAITVANLDDSGPGSLRQALVDIGEGGTISFDPALAGQILALTSGQLTIERDVTIDASAAPGLIVSGGGISRVFQVNGGVTASMNDLVVADGVGAPQGGGILNFGTLNLNRVVVSGNVESSAGPPSFNLGGGGIYNAENSTLNLTDSTVSGNMTMNQPGGGIYGFFGSTVNITRSTISDNVGADVAGGLRSLGNANIVNSTFSGNTSVAWHGGGIFHTDGQLNVDHSTFAENIAPAGTASGILVATFGAPADMTISNSVLEGNGGAFACAIEGGGAATITSAGGNVISDGSCNPDGITDQSFTDALPGPLADNGGPTLTHALLPGSPAIDSAVGTCPDIDQRGEARPQGAGCDSGAFEASP